MEKDYQDLEVPVVTIPDPWTFKDLVSTVTFKLAYTDFQVIQRQPTSIQSVRPALGETLNVDED